MEHLTTKKQKVNLSNDDAMDERFLDISKVSWSLYILFDSQKLQYTTLLPSDTVSNQNETGTIVLKNFIEAYTHLWLNYLSCKWHKLAYFCNLSRAGSPGLVAAFGMLSVVVVAMTV